MDSHGEAREFLAFLRTSYPIFLFTVFVVAFFVNSILAASRVRGNNHNAVCTGPGGRPLPKRSRSLGTMLALPQPFSERTVLLFRWLSVGLLLTFAVDAVVNIIHVIVRRSQHWWPGQAFVVSEGEKKKVHQANGLFSSRSMSLAHSSSMRSFCCHYLTQSHPRRRVNSSRG